MEKIERKEVIASVLVICFVAVFFAVSVYDLVSMDYAVSDVLVSLGVSLLLLHLAFTPRVFFVPFKETLNSEIPIVLISRKTLSFFSVVAFVVFVLGTIGNWIF